MRVHARILNPKQVEVAMTLVMTLDEAEQLQTTLREHAGYGVYPFNLAIAELGETLRKNLEQEVERGER